MTAHCCQCADDLGTHEVRLCGKHNTFQQIESAAAKHAVRERIPPGTAYTAPIMAVGDDTTPPAEQPVPTYDLTFGKLQGQVADWSNRNFGDGHRQPSWSKLIGVMEEVGELAHAHLKHFQGIRGFDSATAKAKKSNAVADIVVFLADYCRLEGIDFQEAVELGWREVSARDWKRNPQDGMLAFGDNPALSGTITGRIGGISNPAILVGVGPCAVCLRSIKDCVEQPVGVCCSGCEHVRLP